MNLTDYLTFELRNFYRNITPAPTVSGIPKSLSIESTIQYMKEGEFEKLIRPVGRMVGGANANSNSNAVAP